MVVAFTSADESTDGWAQPGGAAAAHADETCDDCDGATGFCCEGGGVAACVVHEIMERTMVELIGIAGGTGDLGRGLAARWAIAGLPVRIGSRSAERGQTAAEELAAELPSGAAPVTGGQLAELEGCDIIVLSVPFESVDGTVEAVADAADGCTVVSALNPLAFDAAGPYVVPVDGGSVAEQVAARLPTARVVAGFHTVSNRQLSQIDRPMDEDVPVVGDDEEAVATVVDLANRIEGCRGVAVGPLRLASTLESITPVLISLNKRHKAHTGIRFSGLHLD